ncbi:MAG: hypothetical protein HGA82_01100 [Anaerolineales bacterium]|nr:hypothetical protein [Anaerolineales bacterium]
MIAALEHPCIVPIYDFGWYGQQPYIVMRHMAGGSLADRLATPADGAVVIFEGRTRETPGTPAPGEEAEARRHAGFRVEALEYEAFDTLAISVLVLCPPVRKPTRFW